MLYESIATEKKDSILEELVPELERKSLTKRRKLILFGDLVLRKLRSK